MTVFQLEIEDCAIYTQSLYKPQGIQAAMTKAA